jgi:hypothetical protein
VLLFRNRFVLFALAAGLAAAVTGCSGNRTILPSGGDAAAAARVSGRTFTRAKSQPPDFMQMAYLMTDGSILTQGNSTWSSWYRYVPDASGNYANGTWSQVASLPTGYAPSAFASDVLADGRLAIIGGEYNIPGNYDLQLVSLGAIYDPVKNTWKNFRHPRGWHFIGDSPSSILPNGLFFIGDKLTKHVATWNSKNRQWTAIPHGGKADWNAEEGYTLLPDGTILTADVLDAPNSEIFNPATGTWKSAGSTIVTLASKSPYHQCLTYGPKTKDCYLPPGEIGPAILRPDGTVFATGSGQGGSGSGTGHTAIYDTKSGKWKAGPDFPNGDNAGDNFAALLPNGDVLVYGDSGQMYEFDGSTMTSLGYEGGSPLLLPTGQVIMFGSSVTLYTPSGSADPSWAPSITKAPTSITRGSTYTISGTQFNGMSQAMAFGDEFQNATNYPLVRITNSGSGNVYYARTHDHSSMGVATGSLTVTTHFDVPASMATGKSTLVVVANGIASKPVTVTVK